MIFQTSLQVDFSLLNLFSFIRRAEVSFVRISRDKWPLQLRDIVFNIQWTISLSIYLQHTQTHTHTSFTQVHANMYQCRNKNGMDLDLFSVIIISWSLTDWMKSKWKRSKKNLSHILRFLKSWEKCFA